MAALRVHSKFAKGPSASRESHTFDVNTPLMVLEIRSQSWVTVKKRHDSRRESLLYQTRKTALSLDFPSV
jgi:hypothetical protein